MARIKHPDTFRCDLCGREMSDSEVNRMTAPFIRTHTATEWGLKPKDRPEYGSQEFDLCDACLRKVVVIREIPGWYQDSRFAFRYERDEARCASTAKRASR